MLIVDKISAVLSGVTRRDLEHLTPPQKRKLAFVLRKIADLADPPTKRPYATPTITSDGAQDAKAACG